MAFGDIVHSKVGTTVQGGASTLQITLDSTPTEGNLLVAASATRSDSQTTPSGWSLGVSQDAIDDNLTIYYKVAGSGESTSVTFYDGVATQVMLAAVYEIEGPWNATPLDATNGAFATNNTAISTGTTCTLAQADEIVVAALSPSAQEATRLSNWAVDSSFIMQHDGTDLEIGYTSGDYPSYLCVATKLVSATDALNPQFTWTPGALNIMATIVTFKKSVPAYAIPEAIHSYRQRRL